MRTASITVLLLVILGAIGWWLFRLDDASTLTSDAWEHLPVNVALIAEVQDPVATWERFTGSSQWWTAWDSTPGCVAMTALMARVQAATEADRSLRDILARSSVLVTFQPVGERVEDLLIWSIPTSGTKLAELARIVGCASVTSEGMPGAGMVTCGEAGSPRFYICRKGGSLLMSSSAAVLETALAKKGAKQPVDSTFQRARESLGAGSEARILLHISRTRRILAKHLQPHALDALDELDGWIALDGRSRPEAFLVSGLIFPTRTPALMAANGQDDAQRFTTGRVLHPTVHTVSQINVSDAEAVSTRLRGSSSDGSLFPPYGAWVHGTIARAESGTVSDSTWAVLAVLQTEDPTRAQQALLDRCEACDTLSYRGVRMTHSVDTGALAAVWGDLFDDIERPWWCLVGDKALFSDRIGALRASIDAWQDGASLAQDLRTGGFFQRYATEAAYLHWRDARSTLDRWRPIAEPDGGSLERYSGAWDRLGALLIQTTPAPNGLFEITASLSFTGSRASPESDTSGTATPSTGSSALWSMEVGAAVQRGPWLVEDHLSRTRMLLVQDEKNRIALISCTGKLMWRMELDGPILGDVHQVDRYRNGKLQMLFNTAKRIHLIDRNGKNVERFPIDLKEAASGPLSVFDYENKKDYRVLVPTEAKHLLNFDMNAQAVTGWAPPATSDVCQVPVEHLRVRGKDHVILVDDGGRITVLDRKGNPRYEPKARIPKDAQLIGLLPAMEIGDVRVLWMDADGRSQGTTLAGKTDTITVTPNAPIGAIRYPNTGRDGSATPQIIQADINADGRPERIEVRADGHIETQALP